MSGGIALVFQLGSALLDACVLSVLSGGDAYGYVITQAVKSIMDVSESAIYPVLYRLKKEGYLVAYDMPHGGRNRRYYSITDKGRELLSECRQEWEKYKKNVDNILKEINIENKEF